VIKRPCDNDDDNNDGDDDDDDDDGDDDDDNDDGDGDGDESQSECRVPSAECDTAVRDRAIARSFKIASNSNRKQQIAESTGEGKPADCGAIDDRERQEANERTRRRASRVRPHLVRGRHAIDVGRSADWLTADRLTADLTSESAGSSAAGQGRGRRVESPAYRLDRGMRSRRLIHAWRSATDEDPIKSATPEGQVRDHASGTRA